MSMRVLISNDTSVVKAGAVIHWEFPQNPSEVFPRNVAIHDLMLTTIGQSYCYMPVGYRKLKDVFGFRSADSMDTEIISTDPSSHMYSDQMLIDDNVYANFSRNIFLAQSLLTGASQVLPDSSGENAARHYTVSGELIGGQTLLDHEDFEFPFIDGYPVECKRLLAGLPYQGLVTNLQPLQVSPISIDTPYYRISILDVLSSYTAYDVIRSIVDVSGVYLADRTMSKISFDHSDTHLHVSWHMLLHASAYNGAYSYIYEWDSSLDIDFSYLVNYRDPMVGSVYSTTTKNSGLVFSYTNGFSTDPGAQNLLSDSSEYAGSLTGLILLSTGEASPLDQSQHTRTILKRGYIHDSIEKFRSSVDESFLSIVPSCLFSSVDAFKDSERSLNTNILQNLQKLPQFLDTFEFIQKGVKLLGKLSKRDLDSSTIKDILDVFTSSKLAYDFSIRPYLDVFNVYLPQLINLMGLLGATSKRSIGHGSFRYQFKPGTFSRNDSSLLTHTKLVMDTSGSSLLSAVLGTDAIGVLPKPSNLWDLVPFTFVVNWFTGVGAALRRAEYSAILSTIPAYYVHTYLVTSPFTKEELASWQLTDSTEGESGLRAFYRDVTIYSPVPKDSVFGFGIPQGLPPLGTLGSLLFQLIFG